MSPSSWRKKYSKIIISPIKRLKLEEIDEDEMLVDPSDNDTEFLENKDDSANESALSPQISEIEEPSPVESTGKSV